MFIRVFVLSQNVSLHNYLLIQYGTGNCRKGYSLNCIHCWSVTRLLPVFTLDLCPAVPFPRLHAKIQREIILQKSIPIKMLALRWYILNYSFHWQTVQTHINMTWINVVSDALVVNLIRLYLDDNIKTVC